MSKHPSFSFYVLLVGGYIVIAIVFGTPWVKKFLLYQRLHQITELTPTPTPSSEKLEGKPVQISIVDLNISLPVVEGTYNSQTHNWSVASNKANFASVTPFPNTEQGNTVIYGHNNREVFKSTTKLKPGTQLIVETENGLIFEYHFVKAETVLPDNVSIFSYQGAPQLTVIACEGIWNSKRREMYFQFDRVTKKAS
jgi:LPXTG-site transpeptidase (sortase) family protein